jgi:hypothetical protein
MEGVSGVTGPVSLVTFFAPKKVTRPPGRDPAMVEVEKVATRKSMPF